MAFHDELIRRLLTDWRREEGATKAGEMLSDMDYPSLVSLLPYRQFDSDKR